MEKGAIMTDEELLSSLEYLQNTMVSVATGGPRIYDVNEQYQRIYAKVAATLARRNLNNPILFGSLWDWYGHWKSEGMTTYQDRRNYISKVISPLINQLKTGQANLPELTGWQRVDRGIEEIRDRLTAANNEEKYQAVGLLCREVLISLAQSVYNRVRHPPADDIEPSPTDAKRMLENYILVELSGGANEAIRRHARSALDLANALQHRRTATFRDVAMCVEATASVVNVIAIVDGRRDPK
ncbi:MAG: hypothetical protein LH606_03245 [Cytophagaceae bacterium]|nr:hypothetical protein [Cytophagaceae bacterium]